MNHFGRPRVKGIRSALTIERQLVRASSGGSVPCLDCEVRLLSFGRRNPFATLCCPESVSTLHLFDEKKGRKCVAVSRRNSPKRRIYPMHLRRC